MAIVARSGVYMANRGDRHFVPPVFRQTGAKQMGGTFRKPREVTFGEGGPPL